MVDNSPRTIAVSHVLHRLLMPRHPPCALKHLTTTRCSHPLCNTQHTTEPRHQQLHHPHNENVRSHQPDAAGEEPLTGCPLRTQQCAEPLAQAELCVPPSAPTPTIPNQRDSHGHHGDVSVKGPPKLGDAHHSVRLLRKEVIQPHLPVRLPCYDFVPIASPTFDDSLHKGWAASFGCYQLS